MSTHGRRCVTCGNWKDAKEFTPHGKASKYRGSCMSCEGIQKVANRVDPQVRKMLSAAKSRAKVRGIPFTITAADISLPARCPVLFIPLGTGDRDNAASLDRIVPSKGYVPDNVIVISQRANRIKNDATPAELHAIAEFFSALEQGHSPPTIRI